MGNNADRDRLFEEAKRLGWTRVDGKGYTKLLCPCGEHKTWVHKTPSNPNYYRERLKFIGRFGCGSVA